MPSTRFALHTPTHRTRLVIESRSVTAKDPKAQDQVFAARATPLRAARICAQSKAAVMVVLGSAAI